MALTSLWKMLCCSTWWSTSGRSVPKLWLLSLSWEGRVEKGVWARAGGLAARPVRLGSAPPRAGRGVSRVAPSGIRGEAVTFIYTRPLM